MDCIFCKLVNKEIPALILHEDNEFLAFLDVNPFSEGHTLIVPKKHCRDIFETEDDVLSKLMPLAREIANKLKKATGFDGLNLMQNNAPEAGQSVFHFHLHLIPRYKGDGVNLKPLPGKASPDELAAVQKRILG